MSLTATLVGFEIDYYKALYNGKDGGKIDKMKLKDGELTPAGENSRCKLRKQITEEEYNTLCAYINQEFTKSDDAEFTDDGQLKENTELKDYLDILHQDFATKKPVDEVDGNPADFIAARFLNTYKVMVETTPNSRILAGDECQETIKFVFNHRAYSAYISSVEQSEDYDTLQVLRAKEAKKRKQLEEVERAKFGKKAVGYTEDDEYREIVEQIEAIEANNVSYSLDTFIYRFDKRAKGQVLQDVKLAIKAQADRVPSDYPGWTTKIPLLNGYFDIQSGKLIPYKDKDIAPYMINRFYVEGGKPMCMVKDIVDKVFVRKQELIEIFSCYVAVCASSWLGLKGCLVGIGPNANNGKSTLGMIATLALGSHNVKVNPLQDLFKDTHGTADLKGALLNICDDVDSSSIKDAGSFKTVVTAPTISINPKYGGRETIRNRCSHIIWGNSLPRIGSGGGDAGVMTRMIIIEMQAHFSDEYKEDDWEKGHFKRNVKLAEYEYTDEELNAYLSYCLDLLAKEYNNRGSVIDLENENLKEAKEEYRMDTDPIYRFVKENDYDIDKLNGLPKKQVYEEYVAYINNAKMTATIINFGKRLKLMFPDLEEGFINRQRVWKSPNA